MKIYLAGQNGAHNICKYIWLAQKAARGCSKEQQETSGGVDDITVYMAGAVTGNLNPVWKDFSHTDMKEKDLDASMQAFLADLSPFRNEGIYDKSIINCRPYILESFYYADSDTERLIPWFGDFLLDSGAFTFMQNSKTHVNWDEYIRKFADFINRNNVQKFFELDIDSVVGYEKVKEYRHKLEQMTGKRVIPVWHTSRGIEEFKRMCDEYSYVAIGGIVSKEIKENGYKAFPMMIKEAHKRGAKIHGLGFTSLNWLPKCHFDSVDSTAWTTGNRFGFVYKFDGKTMVKYDAPKGTRIKDSRWLAANNFAEWVKFQEYAKTHL